MARTIATIGGVGLVPGVSANRRLYTSGAVARAASRLQERIDKGDAPPVMLSFHGADDSSREITASLTKASVDDEGRLRFEAGIADTAAGRDIAALTDASDGKPHLRGVSIRGYWLGKVRKEDGPDGKPVETAPDISIEGIDFTKTPGVKGAQVDTFAWAGGSGRRETTERVLITESAEAQVTITEETAEGQKSCEDMGHQCCRDAAGRESAPPAGLLETFGAGHVLENGACVTCAVAEGGDAPGDGSKPYGNVTYADPGYQADKKKRYPIDTKAHAKSAYSYLSQKSNAAKYTSSQLKRMMGRIKGALKRFGVSVSAESAGWSWSEPLSVSEAVAEWYPGMDQAMAGSYYLTASNGPTCLTISSDCLDPEDLDPVMRAAVDAVCQALAALDPDMDGDIDVPGADSADTDDDGGHETAPDDDLGETAPDPAEDPADQPATETETEVPAMPDTATTETAAGQAPAATEAAPQMIALTAEQFQALLARPAAETAPPAAQPAATEAAPAPPVAETREAREARLSALVEARLAEAAKAEGLVTEETDEQIVARLIEARLTPMRQAAAEKGQGVARKGLLESIAEQAPGTGKKLQEASGQDLALLAATAFPPPPRLSQVAR